MQSPRQQQLFGRCWLKLSILLGVTFVLLVAVLLITQKQIRLFAASPAAFSCANVSDMPIPECDALVALYNSTNGIQWADQTNWLQSTSACTWYGITCQNGHVQEIVLGNNQLSGSLPAILGDLTGLQTLYLVSNQLSGLIPSELGKLTNLQALYLAHNQLQGPISHELATLPELQHLDLGYNQLNGPIPPSFGNLANLQDLNLGVNQLSGSIPPVLAANTQLTNLNLGSNHLSGELPRHWLLPALTELSLEANQITGTIPGDLGRLTNLQILDLDDNQLNGEIPLSLVDLTHLQLFSLDYNLLSASEPNVRTFLDTHNPGWASTQTVPPTALQVLNRSTTSVALAWSPIAYQGTNGGYDVEVATRPDGPTVIQSLVVDTNASVYTVNGLYPGHTYAFSVRTYMPPHDAQQNALTSAFSQPITATTEVTGSTPISLVAIYMLALDNNLSMEADSIIQAFQAATAESSSKIALLLVDRDQVNDTQILEVVGGNLTAINGLPDPTTYELSTNLREYNMADPAQLGAFLKWARIHYPAPQTVLSYIGHGVALAPATDIACIISGTCNGPTKIAPPVRANELSEKQPVVFDQVLSTMLAVNDSIFPLPSRQHMTPGLLTDAQSKSLISPYALAEALRIGTDNGKDPLSVLDIVHCFGGTIEELYELAPYVHAIAASPNYAYAGASLLKEAFANIQPGQPARHMAATIIDAYDRALGEADQSDGSNIVHHPRIMVAVESQQIPAIKYTIDNLAVELMRSFIQAPDETRVKIATAHQNSQAYDTTLCDLPPERKQDWKLDSEDAVSDLADFVTQLQSQFGSSTNVAIAATSVITQVNAAVIKTIRADGLPWFADPKSFWTFKNNAKGIGIYNDFQGINNLGDGKTYLGWQAHWYRRDISSDNPHPYAFVKDGTVNWSDVVLRFWQDQLGPNSSVQTIACATKLPDVHAIYRLYLPWTER